MNLLEEVFDVFVLDVEVGVEADPRGGIAGDVLLTDAVWVRKGSTLVGEGFAVAHGMAG